jgi:hypothetical protein
MVVSSSVGLVDIGSLGSSPDWKSLVWKSIETMKAVIVCVDYADFLEQTLPYNRHHFEEVCIVTTSKDLETHRVAKQNDAILLQTNIFYERKAFFDKYSALEEGFDRIGREGWLAIIDADIVFPKQLSFENLQVGNIYGTVRRMWSDMDNPFPPESEWEKLPEGCSINFAGYTQIFHASDRSLPSPPWHGMGWPTAGYGDLYFSRFWKSEKRIRLPFPVLHLGKTYYHWAGRIKD